MTTPYYLQAPQGDEYQPSFLDKLGNGIGKAWDATPPEAFFALAQAMVRPGPFVRNLTEGITGLGQQLQAKNKKRGLASALESLKGGMSPEQQQIISMLDPEQAVPLLAQNAFAKPNEPTSAIQNYQYAVQHDGERRPFSQWMRDLAMQGGGNQGVVSIPGMGSFDKFGNPVAGGDQPAPTPPPQDTTPPPPAPPPQAMPKVNPAPFGVAPGDGGAMVGGLPPMESTPQPAPAPQTPPAANYKPILGPVQERMGLSAAPQGKQWVFGSDLKPMLIDVPGFTPTPTQLPAEVAARVGLAEGFLKRYGEIAKKLPELESLGGRAQILFNTGAGAEVKRHIESGAEALIRSLTGAGKSKEEAESYASRYLPSPLDTAFDLKSKLEGLKYDLESSISGTMSGRGGWKSPASAPEPSKEDLEFTAKKYGISVEEVKRRLNGAR